MRILNYLMVVLLLLGAVNTVQAFTIAPSDTLQPDIWIAPSKSASDFRPRVDLGNELGDGTGSSATGRTYIKEGNAEGLGSDLVTNGDMETGDPPSTWVGFADGVADERTGGSGSQSGELQVSATNGSATQEVTTVANTLYKVTYWVKNIDADSVKVQIWDDAAYTTKLAETDGLESETTWAEKAIYFVAISAQSRFRLRISDAGDGETRLDDVSIKPVTEPSSPTLTTALSGETRVENPNQEGRLGWLIEPAGANICLQSRQFDTSWTEGGAVTSPTQDETGVDGTSNKAWTLSDDTGAGTGEIHQQFETSADTTNYCFSVYVKKTTGASYFPCIRSYWNGGSLNELVFNPNTGAITANDMDGGEVVDCGDWWRVWGYDANTSKTYGWFIIHPAYNSDGTTTADATATGSIIIDCAQIEYNKTYPSSYVNNATGALGSDLGTDSDCSGGTLTTGAGWAHDGVNNEYDATASSANLTDAGILTSGKSYRIKVVFANDGGGSFQIKAGTNAGTAIDANGTYYQYLIANGTDLVFDATGLTGSIQSYEVKECGAVRTTESGNPYWTLPSNLFAESLGSEIATGTLTAGNTYKITADVGDHFYTGSATGEYFVSNGTETCDASNKVKQVTNAWDGMPPHGTLVTWWRPGVDDSDMPTGNNSIVTTNSADDSNVLYMLSSDNAGSHDGTTGNNFDIDFSAGDWVKLAVQWGYLTSNVAQFRVGADDDGTGIVWNTASDYDGSFNPGAGMYLGTSVKGPEHVGEILIFKRILSDGEIDGL